MSTMDTTIWDGKRSIQLTLTDMRDSTWNVIPEGDRRQINVELKDVEICEDMLEASFTSLRNSVLKNVVRGSESKNRRSSFEIANPDFGRISKENVKTLKNHECLILVDKDQQEFPFRYTQKYSTVPHTRAVTDQEGKFYGGEEHNPAGFAIAELVDNALSATAFNKGKRLIEIHFFNQGLDKSSIHVLDNGCGMNSQTIQSSLKYKAPKESRNNQLAVTTAPIVPLVSSPQSDGYEDAHPIHINSNISKFGAGMKQSVFWLGQEVTLMTKSADSKNTCEVRLSQNKMEEREKEENKDPWQQKQCNGKPEELYNYKFWSLMHSEIVPQYKEKSFTHISVEVIRHQGSPSPLNLLKLEDSKYEIAQSVEKQLAHIYHYYLHGRKSVDKNAAPGKESQLEITVNRYDSSGNLTTSRKLRQLDDDSLDLEAQFVRTMTPNPFLFTIEVANYNGISSFNVGGIIRYHPFILDRETNPAGIMARKRNVADPSVDSDGSSSSNDKEGGGESIIKSTEFFQIWWNGRLIPMTKLESFDFCSPGTRLKPGDKMYKSYGRLSGSLFLDSKIKEITDNKLNLTTTAELSKLFNEKTIGSNQSTFHRILPLASSSSSRKMQKRGVGSKDFVKWLKECQKYDKQVTYSGLSDNVNPPKKNFVKYKAASWEGVILKEGSFIKLKNPDALGKVVGFWVERENRSDKEDPLDAPLGEVEILLLPSSYYTQGNQQFSMHLIDLCCVNKKAEEQIKERTEALNMQLQILHWDQELRNGDERKIDEFLIKGLVAFDVINSQGVSVKSVLPYVDKGKAGKRSAKQIFMTSRVYRVYDNGVRQLYYTSGLSKWDQTTDLKGFYFKDLNLAEMNMDEIGNFVIIFITYVKETSVGTTGNIQAIEAPPTTTTTTTRGGRGRGRPQKSPVTPTPETEESQLPEELDYAEYWKKEVDELGRKIFREDQVPSNSRKQSGPQIIRLPYLEINFKVIPGSPAKLDIVAGGDNNPIKIGQTFDASVLIKDSKGNRVLDDDTWNMLRAQRPNISVTGRSSSDVQFIVSSGKFVKDENSAQALIIKNILIKGYLNGHDSKECKLEVKVTLGENELTNFVNITIYPGLPNKIESLDDPAQLSQIENSSKPKLAAQVLDASGNILQINRKKKPIMLRAEFYRKRELTPVCQGNFLCASQEDGAPQELRDTIIELPELKTGNIVELSLICKIIYDQEDSSLPQITKVLQVTVVPSTKPDKLKLFIKNGKKLTEIGENSDIQLSDCRILVQSNIEFIYKLWDGMGNEISFDESKWKIKLNWPGKQYFNVPHISVIAPNAVENKRKIVSKLLIPDLEKNVKHEFFMTTYPLEINRLKISWQADQPQATILSFPITTIEFPKLVAKFADQFDNLIKIEDFDEIKEEIIISTTPDLDIRPCQIYQGEENDEPNSFLIKFGLRAFNGGYPPETDVQLNVSFREIFHDTVRFNLVAGPPNQIALEIGGTLQSGRVTCPLPNLSVVPLRAIFLDAAKNRTEVTEDTKVILRFFPKANWYPQEDFPIREFTVNKKSGAAEFGSIIVGVSPTQILGSCNFQNKRCPGICFGKLTVTAEAKLNANPITAKCEFHVKARQDAPHKLDVSFQGSQFLYKAGSSFEGLSVTLEAEDGSTIVTAEQNQLRLVLDESISIYPSLVQEGTFIFGKVPDQAGNYTADFVYEVDGIVVTAKVEDGLTIVAGEVKEFGSVGELPEYISVSNDPNRPEARIISNDLTLALKDEYGNSCSNSNGRVIFKSPIQLENHEQLVSKEYNFVNGKLKFPPLIIQPGTALPNNSKHKLKFTAIFEERSLIFELEFNFYDNIHQQEKIHLLNLSLGELNRSIKAKEDKTKEIRKEVEKYQAVLNAKYRVQEGLLRELGYQIDNPDVNTREHLLRTNKRRLLEQRTGAESNILPSPADNEPGVLGQVGLLAQVKSGSSFQQDKELQRVLTWHLGKQLFVTVVQTRKEGLELRDKFPGKQFMLLDVIKDRPDLNWNEQRQVLRGPGNPIYARSILHIPNQTQTPLVQKVFNVVLGNTIIVDTLEDATAFMEEYNRRERGTCPTLLTRDGHRLSANGIIGGNFNTAPPLVENQRKLGIASSSELERIEAELILIAKFRAAVSETIKAKQDYEEYSQRVASVVDQVLKDITAEKKEKQLKESQLESIREEYESQQPQISPQMTSRQKPRTRSFTPCQQGPTGPNNKRPRI